MLPWAAAAGLFVVLVLVALAKARSLDGTIDLAAYTQAAWLITQGAAPVTTITTGTSLFAQQAAFAFYPVAWSTYLLPTIPTLLLVQSAALASAVVPIWKISRRVVGLRVGAAATLMFVYATYPVMHNLNLDGFHIEVIAVPGLLAAFYFALTERWRFFALFAVIVMLSRADLGLAIAGFGGLLAVDGKRRIGLTTVAVGVGWTLVCSSIVQPWIGGDGNFSHLTAFSAFGNTPLSVSWGMLVHPGVLFTRLLREVNFDLVVLMFAPVVFLPLLAPRYLIPVLPLQAIYLVADVPRNAVFGQQTVAMTAFIFLATAFALGRIGRRGVEQITVDKRILGALLIAGSVFFVQNAASSPYRHPWDWGGQDRVDAARLEARDQIPPDAHVRASSSMLQILAERHTLVALDQSVNPDADVITAGVDVVVVDEQEWPSVTSMQWQSLQRAMREHGFELVRSDAGIDLYLRA